MNIIKFNAWESTAMVAMYVTPKTSRRLASLQFTTPSIPFSSQIAEI